MLKVRNKENKSETLFTLISFNPNPKTATFLGKDYLTYDDAILKCDDLTNKEANQLLLRADSIKVSVDDNTGLHPVRRVNVYKWQMTGTCIKLYYSLLIVSQYKDGSGDDMLLYKQEVGTFNSVSLLKDFCNKFKIKLTNNLN